MVIDFLIKYKGDYKKYDYVITNFLFEYYCFWYS